MAKTALITGITGQDGAYLAKFLLEKGYNVYGFLARRGSDTLWRLRYLNVLDDVKIIDGDLLDLSSLIRALELSKPMKCIILPPKVSSALHGSSLFLLRR